MHIDLLPYVQMSSLNTGLSERSGCYGNHANVNVEFTNVNLKNKKRRQK